MWSTLDDIYERIGNRKLAIANYKRSLELNPGNTNATNFLRKVNEPIGR